MVQWQATARAKQQVDARACFCSFHVWEEPVPTHMTQGLRAQSVCQVRGRQTLRTRRKGAGGGGGGLSVVNLAGHVA